MNEFSARKLGEVLAFSEIGSETFVKGRDAFSEVFGEAKLSEFIEGNDDIKSKIIGIINNSELKETVLKKAEATGRKLRHMRDYYIGDDWHDSAEMLEWSGFFLGAAIVHWKLVEGAAEVLENDELKELSTKGVEFHEDLLSEVNEKIKLVGMKKAV